jgi:hypothetical protein
VKPFGPPPGAEPATPLDLTAAERAFAQRTQARQAKARADYERRQRGDYYRPTLRATPVTKERK